MKNKENNKNIESVLKSKIKTLVRVLLLPAGMTIAITAILFYFTLPALNFKSIFTWIITIIISIFFTMFLHVWNQHNDQVVNKLVFMFTVIAIGLPILFVILSMTSITMFRARSYADILEGYITEDSIENYKATLDNVPLIDKDSALNLKNRELGSLIDVVSQFEINDSEQITLNKTPVRVSALQYGGFFKWVNNNQSGTPGYIKLDMRTQNAELVRVVGGIKYSPSERFGRNLGRYLRFNYPTYMFDQPKFELNEEGHPYYIAPIIDHTIGLFGGIDVIGVVTVDAVTGELKEYKVGEIPEWIDNVYDSNLLMKQYDYFGRFQNGFWNSIFGQKGVKVTTRGYNYIPQDNDNWIYTGVTSTGRDESNIGFILSNKRTKETIYYPVSGAEEYSAMASAEGVVQHLGYISTFPLLLQVQGEPTYVVALKDAGGLVKMYGMVNVEKYQIVATGSSIVECEKKYKTLLSNNGIKNITDENLDIITGRIEDLRSAVIEGTTIVYIKLEGRENFFSLSTLMDEEVILLDLGDIVTISIADASNKIVPANLK